jgi:hypothetical protein
VISLVKGGCRGGVINETRINSCQGYCLAVNAAELDGAVVNMDTALSSRPAAQEGALLQSTPVLSNLSLQILRPDAPSGCSGGHPGQLISLGSSKDLGVPETRGRSCHE